MGSGSKLVRAVESTINLRMIYFHYSTIGDGAPCVINYGPPLFFFSTFSLEILRVRRAYIFLIFSSFSCASGATGEEFVGSARRIVGDGTSPSPRNGAKSRPTALIPRS